MLLGGREPRVRAFFFSVLFPLPCNSELAHSNARSFGLRIWSVTEPTTCKIFGKVLVVKCLIFVGKTLTFLDLIKKRRLKRKGSSVVLPRVQQQLITVLEFIRNKH